MDIAQSKDSDGVKPLRILLVDDARMILERLERALQAIPDVSVIGTCQNTSSAIRAIDEEKPDVVVLDVSLGTDNGWEVLKHVTATAPDSDVYMFSNDTSDTAKDRFLLGGATEFFDKSLEFAGLLATIRRKVRARSLS